MKENIFLILPINELENIIERGKIDSSKRIHLFFDLEKVQESIISIINDDKKRQEYCCVTSKISDSELKIYKISNSSKINYDKILEKMVSVYYLLLKNENLELISFDFDKNFDFIKMILDLKKTPAE